jgi:phosphate starvation-inducible protein PhoH
MVLALQDADQHIVVTAGPAGTGKTYLAMLAAVKAFRA